MSVIMLCWDTCICNISTFMVKLMHYSLLGLSMNKLKSFRGVFFISFLLVLLFLVFQYYLQVTLKLQPCPMTLNARILLLTLGLLFLTFSLLQHTYSSQKYTSWVCLLVCFAGLFITGKHMWVQISGAGTLPQITAAQLQALPFTQILKLGIGGSASCATPIWTWFGLSLTMWTFVLFLAFTFVSLMQARRELHQN